MSMISEQVKELRYKADIFEKSGCAVDGIVRAFREAAETIEALSAKLATANSGWIPCSERLPEEHDSIFAKLKGTDKWSNAMFEKTSNEVNATIKFEDGKRAVKTLHTIDGRWSEGHRGVKFKVVAWQPLPEEYHG